MSKSIRAYVDERLLDTVKQKFSEVKGLSATGVVDWALRYLLKLQEAEYMAKEA